MLRSLDGFNTSCIYLDFIGFDILSIFEKVSTGFHMKKIFCLILLASTSFSGCLNKNKIEEKKQVYTTYQDLVTLFHEWRNFEKPPIHNGVPDYTQATFEKRWPQFKAIQTRLQSFDTTGWRIEEQIDWHILRAEISGYQFNHEILKPWQRDPAFYKSVWMRRSDVPAHEGPTHHAITEVWTYDFPLTSDAAEKLLQDIEVIPALNQQAQKNLTGNARDLWIAGIRDIRQQSLDLQSLLSFEGVQQHQALVTAINQAIASTDELAGWLEGESAKKTGPSGIGKDNYSWYLKNVHLVPLSWDDEVMLLKRELARAWTALKLEEHKNRHLPPLVPVASEAEYQELARRSAESLFSFLEKEEVVTVKEYFKPALEAQLGQYVPVETRNFFWITAHLDPRPLYSHFYHWFELARMDLEPHKSEIRRVPLLYNIFDSRNEGMATAVEEIFMDAGLYEENPRVKEIVYIMIAQRAARGLGSLYAHANQMTMTEAGSIHSEYTPRGWMKTEKELLIFEQHLYLRQPGYGTSYITGKYLMEEAMMEFARLQEMKGETFAIKDYFDNLNSFGNIPMSLATWQLTGEAPDFLLE